MCYQLVRERIRWHKMRTHAGQVPPRSASAAPGIRVARGTNGRWAAQAQHSTGPAPQPAHGGTCARPEPTPEPDRAERGGYGYGHRLFLLRRLLLLCPRARTRHGSLPPTTVRRVRGRCGHGGMAAFPRAARAGEQEPQQRPPPRPR